MGIHTRRLTIVIMSAALLLGIAGCAEKPKELTPEQVGLRDELAQEFMGEIQSKILPERDNVTYLLSLGMVVSEEERVKDIAALDAFAESFLAGDDCSLTVAFLSKSFVVARYQLRDGVGCYFRYEHKETDEAISVTSKLFDQIRVEREDAPGKVQLGLEYGGQEIATFTFRPQEKAS